MSAREPSISDETVQAKTGRDLAAWFAILDAAGAQEMTHQQIAAYLAEQHGVGPWWQQMVTVTYEQRRDLLLKAIRAVLEPLRLAYCLESPKSLSGRSIKDNSFYSYR